MKTIFAITFVGLIGIASAADVVPFTHGRVLFNVTDRGEMMTYQMRYAGNDLRIEHTEILAPAPPINLVQLTSGRLRILRPHNSTWQEWKAAKTAQTPTPEAEAVLNPKAFITSLRQGERVLGGQEGLTLVSLDEERTIQGFPCTRHVIEIPTRGTLTLWLTERNVLPPFHLLHGQAAERADEKDWRVQVAELLREIKRFPLVASLQSASKRELIRWEVRQILKETPAKGEEAEELFKVPSHFFKMDP